MDKEFEKKRIRKRNSHLIRNYGNKNELNVYSADNTLRKPQVVVHDEISDATKKLADLKGLSRDTYITNLSRRPDSVRLAQRILGHLGVILENNKKVSSEVISAHSSTIDKLAARLSKLNETDNPIEIEKIYYQISDLSKKIQEIDRGWRKISFSSMGAVVLLAVGGIAATIFKNNKQ